LEGPRQSWQRHLGVAIAPPALLFSICVFCFPGFGSLSRHRFPSAIKLQIPILSLLLYISLPRRATLMLFNLFFFRCHTHTHIYALLSSIIYSLKPQSMHSFLCTIFTHIHCHTMGVHAVILSLFCHATLNSGLMRKNRLRRPVPVPSASADLSFVSVL